MNDGGCFASALASVNCWGGVLEHPADTLAWKAYNLEKPEQGKWKRSGIGWVCEVWQSAYGHKARKRTWLYYVGRKKPRELRWDRINGSHRVGKMAHAKTHKPALSSLEANSTPKAFRDELLKLARGSR